MASLDNPALVNNFVKHLPQRFRTEYHSRALDTDTTRKFNDLLTHVTRSIRATKHCAEEWVVTTDTVKRASNNSNSGHSNKADNQCSLSNRVENNNSTSLNDKVNNSTYASAVSGKPDISNYVCSFCRDTGHAI